MQKQERNYTITEQECLAVHWALKVFHSYVLGRKINLLTDPQALAWLLMQHSPSGRLRHRKLALHHTFYNGSLYLTFHVLIAFIFNLLADFHRLEFHKSNGYC